MKPNYNTLCRGFAITGMLAMAGIANVTGAFVAPLIFSSYFILDELEEQGILKSDKEDK